jgi:type IV secretion system protein TrbI
MDTTDHAPPATPKVDPESLALRASPRPVTRLNRRTLMVAFGVLALAIAGASMWALHSQGHRSADRRELYNVDRVAKAEDLDRLPADYSKLTPNPAPASAASVLVLGPPLPGELGTPVLQASRSAGLSSDNSAGTDQERDAEEAARSSVFFRTGSVGVPEIAAPTSASASSVAQNALASPFNALSTKPTTKSAQPTDPSAIQNRQDQKEAFLTSSGNTATRNEGDMQAPVSPYTVMAGTVIPAALVTGINSDLPGQVIATVTQSVYDTATGQYLLIPQGSRLIGRYDSQVAFGQKRVLLVWTRLILPDTSSIALDKLPGLDLAGYTGLEGGVDQHWGRLLSGAALSTLLGGSSELAV